MQSGRPCEVQVHEPDEVAGCVCKWLWETRTLTVAYQSSVR